MLNRRIEIEALHRDGHEFPVEMTVSALRVGEQYVFNAFLPLNESLAGLARWSPFYYYLTSDPLNNGMHWGSLAHLARKRGVA